MENQLDEEGWQQILTENQLGWQQQTLKESQFEGGW